MKTNLKERKWNSLTQVKEWIESNTDEKVEHFDGCRLITDKYIYGLAFGQLAVRKNEQR